MCDICSSDSVIFGYLIGVIFLISLIFFVIKRNFFLSFLVFSLLVNILFIFAIFVRSLIFQIYGIEWLQYFALFIWPIINIILVVFYVRKKKQ